MMMSQNGKQNDFFASFRNNSITGWNDSTFTSKKSNFLPEENHLNKQPASFKRRQKNLKKYMEFVRTKEIQGRDERGNDLKRRAFKQIYLSNFENLKQEMNYLQTNYKKILITKEQIKFIKHKYYSSLLKNGDQNRSKHSRKISQSIHHRPLTSQIKGQYIFRSVKSECLSRKIKNMGKMAIPELSVKKSGCNDKRFGMLNITINQLQNCTMREVLKSLQRKK